MIFETEGGGRYELDGSTLCRDADGVAECQTDVSAVARVEVGQRAVIMAKDGTFSMTSRVRKILVASEA